MELPQPQGCLQPNTVPSCTTDAQAGFPMEFHQKELTKHCRVCGRSLHKERVVHKCSDYKMELATYATIDTDKDDVSIHPIMFCNICYAALQNVQEGKSALTSLTPFEWTYHSDSGCKVHECKMLRTCARNKPLTLDTCTGM